MSTFKRRWAGGSNSISRGSDLRRFPSLLRSVAVLATGTASGQAISLILMPVITRLYSPADYGALGVFSALVTILGSVAGMKLEAAILLPERTHTGEKTVSGLFWASIVSALAVSLLLFIMAALFLLFWKDGPFASLGEWLLLVPFGTLLTSVSLTLTAMATRHGLYSQLSKVPPAQKLSSGGLQIIGGLAGSGLSGLIAGALMQPAVTIAMLIQGKRRLRGRARGGKREKGEVFRLISEYRDFPLISAPTALLNALALNSQIVILAWFYVSEDLGFYSLALAVVGLPLNVILSAMSQVYLRESAIRRGDEKAARLLFWRLLIFLLSISVPVFVGLFFASGYLIEPLFGAGWASAGLIAQALLPMLWGRFITTTLTTTFTVYRRQSWLLWWQILTLAVTSAGLIFGGLMSFEVAETVALGSWLTLPCYLVIIPLAYFALRGGDTARPRNK